MLRRWRPWREEWQGLLDQGVFDPSDFREYHDVVHDAKRRGEEVHLARAHGIIVEKHSHLAENDSKRKRKGRGVVLKNHFKNQTLDAALFQESGTSPATFEASGWADFRRCLEGWDAQMADAVQAYLQAVLRGAICWIELPPKAVPDES